MHDCLCIEVTVSVYVIIWTDVLTDGFQKNLAKTLLFVFFCHLTLFCPVVGCPFLSFRLLLLELFDELVRHTLQVPVLVSIFAKCKTILVWILLSVSACLYIQMIAVKLYFDVVL